MTIRPVFALICTALLAPGAFAATLSEVVKDVAVLDAGTKASKPARVRDIFATPNVLRTGPDSRAELIADDQTVTRIGANSLFSFERAKREIKLQQGSVLFNTPTGKGGGTIRTAAATASVLGTTLIVVTTKNGGFKVLLVEGRGRVRMPNGSERTLNAGQMVFVLPGQKFGPTYTFQIREQTEASRLVRGFRTPLPSLPKILDAIRTQEVAFAKGTLVKTGLLAGDAPDVAYQISTSTREAAVVEAQQPAAPEPAPQTRFDVALETSATIAAPLLDPAFVFASNDPDLPPRPAGGIATTPGSTLFLAKAAAFSTPTLNLSTYGPGPVVFLATDDLQFTGSMAVTSASGAPLSFVAGGTISNTPLTLITTESPLTELTAFGSAFDFGFTPADAASYSETKPLQLTSFVLRNNGGDIVVRSPSLTLANAGFQAVGDVSLSSTGSISISDSYTANPNFTERSSPNGSDFPVEVPVADTRFSPGGTALAAGNAVNIRAAAAVNITRSDIVAEQLRVSAGTQIVVKEFRFSNKDYRATNPNPARGAVGRADEQPPGTRGRADFQATDLISMTNARFQTGFVNMKADTISLKYVTFANGSRVVLDSRLGQLNNDSVRPGYVNFLGIVNYGGESATGNIIPENQPGPGIVIK